MTLTTTLKQPKYLPFVQCEYCGCGGKIDDMREYYGEWYHPGCLDKKIEEDQETDLYYKKLTDRFPRY